MKRIKSKNQLDIYRFPSKSCCSSIAKQFEVYCATAILQSHDKRDERRGWKKREEPTAKNLAISSGKKAIILMALIPLYRDERANKRKEKKRERRRMEKGREYRTFLSTVYEEARPFAREWRNPKVFSISPARGISFCRGDIWKGVSLSFSLRGRTWEREGNQGRIRKMEVEKMTVPSEIGHFPRSKRENNEERRRRWFEERKWLFHSYFSIDVAVFCRLGRKFTKTAGESKSCTLPPRMEKLDTIFMQIRIF